MQDRKGIASCPRGGWRCTSTHCRVTGLIGGQIGPHSRPGVIAGSWKQDQLRTSEFLVNAFADSTQAKKTAAWEKWKDCCMSWNAPSETLWKPNEQQVMGFIGFMGGFAGSKRGGALLFGTIVAYVREVRAWRSTGIGDCPTLSRQS